MLPDGGGGGGGVPPDDDAADELLPDDEPDRNGDASASLIPVSRDDSMGIELALSRVSIFSSQKARLFISGHL